MAVAAKVLLANGAGTSGGGGVPLPSFSFPGMPLGFIVSDSTGKNWQLVISSAAVDHTSVEKCSVNPALRWVTYSGGGGGGGVTSWASLTGDITTGAAQVALSVQPSNAVAITGGSIAGTTLNMSGNTIFGDSVSGGSLTLSSTSNATKGKIVIGNTSGVVFTEVLAPTSGANTLVDGAGATTVTGAWVLYRNADTNIVSKVINVSAGLTASANFQLSNTALAAGNGSLIMSLFGSASTIGGSALPAKSAQIQLFGSNGNFDVSIAQSAGVLTFGTGASGTARLTILASGVLQFASPSFAANGTQALTLGSTGPAGIGTTTPTKYLTFQDSAGVTSYVPAWQ